MPPFVTSNVWSGFVSVFVGPDPCGEMSLSRDDTRKTDVPRESPGAGGASAGPGRSGGCGALQGGRRVSGRQRGGCVFGQSVSREKNILSEAG